MPPWNMKLEGDFLLREQKLLLFVIKEDKFLANCYLIATKWRQVATVLEGFLHGCQSNMGQK